MPSQFKCTACGEDNPCIINVNCSGWHEEDVYCPLGFTDADVGDAPKFTEYIPEDTEPGTICTLPVNTLVLIEHKPDKILEAMTRVLSDLNPDGTWRFDQKGFRPTAPNIVHALDYAMSLELNEDKGRIKR